MAPMVFWGPNGPGAVSQAFGMTHTMALIPMGEWCGSEKLIPTKGRRNNGCGDDGRDEIGLEQS